MIKDKGSMTQKEHDKIVKEMGLTEEEHKKWHKEHENDPDFWAKKSKHDWKKIK